MKSADIIKIPEANGWMEVAHKGSYKRFQQLQATLQKVR